MLEGEVNVPRRIIGFRVSDPVSPTNTLPFFNFDTKMWELLTHVSEEIEFTGAELIAGHNFTPSTKFIRVMMVASGFGSSSGTKSITIQLQRISDSFVIGEETIEFTFTSANSHQSLGTHLIQIVEPLESVPCKVIMTGGNMSVDTDDKWELYLLN